MRARVAIIALVTCLTLSARSALAAPILSISPSATTVNVGDTFSLDVDITGVTDLYAYNFDLSYDPALLKVVKSGVDDIVEGPFLGTAGSTFFIPGTDDGNGLLSFTANTLLGNTGGGANGGGTLATVSFLALAAGVRPITLGNLMFFYYAGFDSENDEVLLGDVSFSSVDPGSVTVVNPVPEPGTILLLGSGLAVAARRRSKRARQ